MATLLLLSTLLQPVTDASHSMDQVVFGALRQSDSSIRDFKILRRLSTERAGDLVLAMGAPKNRFPEESQWLRPYWSPDRKLGIFVQERSAPYRVFTIAIQAGPEDCAFDILRVTATDAVLSCAQEKGHGPNHKFVYDIRAKRLVRYFTYERVTLYRARSGTAEGKPGGASSWAANDSHHVVIEYAPERSPSFRLLASGEERSSPSGSGPFDVPVASGTMPELARVPLSPSFGPGRNYRLVYDPELGDMAHSRAVEERRGTETRLHRLPASTYDVFAAARPALVAGGHTREHTGLTDGIGPSQTDGSRLWFGKTFYDSEGESGVGGFGYFDAATNRYQMFTSPLLNEHSVSAIFVDSKSVWLALVGHHEYGSIGGGLLRFDRETETFQRIDIGAGIGFQFLQVGDGLILATDVGISVLKGFEATQYFIDKTSDGRLRVAQAIK